MQTNSPPQITLEQQEAILQNRIQAIRNFLNGNCERISICVTVQSGLHRQTELFLFDGSPGKAIPAMELLSFFSKLADQWCAELLAIRMQQPSFLVTATGELKTKGGTA